jgi:hypothetical protein
MANFPFHAYMMLKVFTDDRNVMLVGNVPMSIDRDAGHELCAEPRVVTSVVIRLLGTQPPVSTCA